jgi:hypothetical protein
MEQKLTAFEGDTEQEFHNFCWRPRLVLEMRNTLLSVIQALISRI